MQPSFRLPPLEALVVFEAASRLGSFSRAGNELGLTQSAVSRQIGKLEAFIGSKLACSAQPVEFRRIGIPRFTHPWRAEDQGKEADQAAGKEYCPPSDRFNHQSRQQRTRCKTDAEGRSKQPKGTRPSVAVEFLRKCGRTSGQGRGGAHALTGT